MNAGKAVSEASTTVPARRKRDRNAASTGTVTMQARVDESFASELLEQDAPVLGLSGASELVREGLRLLHRQAREQAMADSYDKFYEGTPAPVSEVTAALWAE
jgi:hypothetical protein